jgi:hypothetical protein
MRCKTKQEEDSRSVDLRVSSHQINCSGGLWPPGVYRHLEKSG